MPQDISEDVFRYLARDWGLSGDLLTDKKCDLLADEIPILRTAYHRNRAIAYHKPLTRRAYLAAFAPRYAYVLYESLQGVADAAQQVFGSWNQSEGVICLLGGGPACEVFGFVDWLYEHQIKPRYLHVVIVDRQAYWRTFHNFLFSELLSRQFHKTLIVPSYEALDFPIPKGKSFDRTTVNYNFAQTALLAEARLISIVNTLSEVPDHRGLECHLRFLTRLAWNPQLVVCADSAAKKRRPRMKWLKPFFDNAENFESDELLAGVRNINCNWLAQGETSQRVFRVPAPRWENSMSRYVYIRKVR